MTIKAEDYVRRPFMVTAIQVTEKNIREIADWCKGYIHTSEGDPLKNRPEGKYIKINVHFPQNERQTQAFVGDWVVYAVRGFKVYTTKAFDATFERATRVIPAGYTNGQVSTISPVNEGAIG